MRDLVRAPPPLRSDIIFGKDVQVAGVRDAARDRPAGSLCLNVPVSAARLVLTAIVPPFLAAYPEIRLEVPTIPSGGVAKYNIAKNPGYLANSSLDRGSEESAIFMQT
jgi:hypothetical protein